jgi:hypothetical protein
MIYQCDNCQQSSLARTHPVINGKIVPTMDRGYYVPFQFSIMGLLGSRTAIPEKERSGKGLRRNDAPCSRTFRRSLREAASQLLLKVLMNR